MKHDHSQGAQAWAKHMLLMLICCLVPLGLVAAVSILGLSLGPLQGLVAFVAALMCPVMMIGMMWMMMRDHATAHADHPTQTPPSTVKSPDGSIKENCH